MIERPPSSPPGAARKRDLIELRVANLRRELEAETDPTAEAAILYEVGVLYEHAPLALISPAGIWPSPIRSISGSIPIPLTRCLRLW